MTRVSELKSKEIINVSDGMRLGFVSDVEIDPSTGKIESLIVAGAYKFFGIFGRENDVVIPWINVEKVGSDLIIVKFQ